MKNFLEIKVSDCKEAMRLDRYLRVLYPNLTQAILEKYLRTGKIKYNSSKCKSNQRIIDGDIITLYFSAEQYTKTPGKEPSEAEKILAKKLLEKHVIFENDDFLVLNKPADLATQGGTSIKISLDSALRAMENENNGKSKT